MKCFRFTKNVKKKIHCKIKDRDGFIDLDVNHSPLKGEFIIYENKKYDLMHPTEIDALNERDYFFVEEKDVKKLVAQGVLKEIDKEIFCLKVENAELKKMIQSDKEYIEILKKDIALLKSNNDLANEYIREIENSLSYRISRFFADLTAILKNIRRNKNWIGETFFSRNWL